MPVTVGIFIDPGVLADGRTNRSFEYDTLSDQYARFLLEEILPEVEKTVTLRRDAASRAIAGTSSGGICAFTVAWERPNEFSKVLSWVGSFTNIASGKTLREGGHNYPAMIRKTPKKPIRVFLQDGANDLDNIHGNWPLANQQMAKSLAFAALRLQVRVRPGIPQQPPRPRHSSRFSALAVARLSTVVCQRRGAMQRRILAAFILASVVCASAAFADVRLPGIISDHMLLQRDVPVRIFGKAAPGEAVSVAFRGQTAQTVTDPLGRWEVWLQPLTPGPAAEMTISRREHDHHRRRPRRRRVDRVGTVEHAVGRPAVGQRRRGDCVGEVSADPFVLRSAQSLRRFPSKTSTRSGWSARRSRSPSSRRSCTSSAGRCIRISRSRWD